MVLRLTSGCSPELSRLKDNASWTRTVFPRRPVISPVVSGFEFLVQQAGPQVELVTGRRPAPLDAMRTAGLKELA